MTDIVKAQPRITDQLPARKEPDDKLFEVVREEIGRAYVDLNYKQPDDLEKTKMVNQVCDDILTYAAQLRLEEIRIAIRNGVRGLYGEFAGLSVATFIRFLLAYLSSSERADRVRKERQLPENGGTPEPTPEEMDARWMTHLKTAFDTVAAGEFFEDFNNEIYKWLDSKGKISFTAERKKSFMEQARQQLTEEKQAEKGSSDYFKRQHLARMIEAIQNEDRPPVVTIRAMKIALNVWIRENLEMEVTPEMIFEDDNGN